MAARNKPAGIRSLVYGMGKGKVRIEGLSVSSPYTRLSMSAFLAASLRSQFTASFDLANKCE